MTKTIRVPIKTLKQWNLLEHYLERHPNAAIKCKIYGDLSDWKGFYGSTKPIKEQTK